MKRLLVVFLSLLLIVASCLSMTSCAEEIQFGEFDYNGITLIQYAKEEISSSEAKSIIKNNARNMGANASEYIEGARDDDAPLPSDEYVHYYTSEYSSCEPTTYYYEGEDTTKKYKEDFIQGTDLKAMLNKNEFTPFNQLIAKNLIIFEASVDYMEEQNNVFKNSEIYDISPFKSRFSYYIDENYNLVIHVRDFAEIPSSVGGGVGCSYRQDTEIVFDTENKITNWQTSLGVYTSTPTGTLKQGYILEVFFSWTPKE